MQLLNKIFFMRERIVRGVAGTIVLVSVLLAVYVNIKWLWVSVFVGINLLQSSITKFCPLEKILDAAGVKPSNSEKL
jgi:hypothetical protein